MKPNRRNEDRIIFRVPDGMREELEGLASANCRTLSGELIYHLKNAIAAHKAASAS